MEGKVEIDNSVGDCSSFGGDGFKGDRLEIDAGSVEINIGCIGASDCESSGETVDNSIGAGNNEGDIIGRLEADGSTGDKGIDSCGGNGGCIVEEIVFNSDEIAIVFKLLNKQKNRYYGKFRILMMNMTGFNP